MRAPRRAGQGRPPGPLTHDELATRRIVEHILERSRSGSRGLDEADRPRRHLLRPRRHGPVRLARLSERGTGFRTEHRTVPGIKDLPVAVRQLFQSEGVDLCLAFGMPGKAEYDKVCAHEASLGLIYAGVLEAKPVVECFVFEAEAKDERELATLAQRRAEEHAENAFDLLFRPQALARRAATGARQGFADAGRSGRGANAPHETRRENERW